MNRSKRYSPEIREPAVRMVFEHQREYESEWAATYNNQRIPVYKFDSGSPTNSAFVYSLFLMVFSILHLLHIYYPGLGALAEGDAYLVAWR